ncbi:hypothetical protein PPH41_34930, partial [Burkholderia gladioli]|nr:hypothetical protein [Burkholderia gladioli]
MPALPYLPFALGHGEARRRASQVDRALCRPATYPHPAGRIERIETHLSVVYLAGRHAYKRLKPVRFAFVDLATAARRQRCAMAQYRLNKRLAGPLYLDIRPLLVLGRRGVFGRPFRPGRRRCASVPGEYVVRMRRFETDALLSVRCARQGPLRGRRPGGRPVAAVDGRADCRSRSAERLNAVPRFPRSVGVTPVAGPGGVEDEPQAR